MCSAPGPEAGGDQLPCLTREACALARYAWRENSAEQASNQFLPRDFEMGRYIGEDAGESPDLQRIVCRDRHMVLRS